MSDLSKPLGEDWDTRGVRKEACFVVLCVSHLLWRKFWFQGCCSSSHFLANPLQFLLHRGEGIYVCVRMLLKHLPKKQTGKHSVMVEHQKTESAVGQDSPSPLPLPSSLSFPHFSFLIFTTSSTNPLWCYFSQQFPSAPSLSGLAVLPENCHFAQW